MARFVDALPFVQLISSFVFARNPSSSEAPRALSLAVKSVFTIPQQIADPTTLLFGVEHFRSGSRRVWSMQHAIVSVLVFVGIVGTASAQSTNTLCSDPKKVQEFVLGKDGKVNVIGKTFEGPLCVQIDFNPLHFDADFSTSVSYVNGPDVSSVFTTGGSNTTGASQPNAPKNRPPQLPVPTPPQSLPEAFAQIEVSYQALHSRLHTLDGAYSQALDKVKQTVADISNAISMVDTTSTAQRETAIKGLYRTRLQASLALGISVQTSYLPSDRVANPSDVSLMDSLNYAKDSIDFLPQQFVTGDANVATSDFDCSSNGPPAKRPGWAVWYTKCKGAYDGLEAEVTTDIAAAQQYSAQSDKVTALRKTLAVVKFWDDRFSSFGLTRDLTAAQINSLNLQSVITKSTPEPCSHFFNKNETATVAISYSDLTPTLNGSAPSSGKTDAFVTISCSSPFSLSAGVGFSTISNPEFAIVKSAGGANNTSVNKFGVLSDSHPHPMPIAIAHVRLHDWLNNLLAAHGSFGVAGNFQGQSSGGSSAEFLVGGSVSVWRTMFLTLGLHIGAKPSLAGGFHVGDVVPSDISSVQVSKSYTTGFGFAITFTKP
jgi:hypothetical protein